MGRLICILPGGKRSFPAADAMPEWSAGSAEWKRKPDDYRDQIEERLVIGGGGGAAIKGKYFPH